MEGVAILTAAATLALYTTDASNYRPVPRGVVLPETVEDVVAAVAAARERALPVIARGGGTSVAGNACGPGLVIDTSRHVGGVLSLDPERRLARVLPGTVLDDLQAAAAPHGLRFGPDPSNPAWCWTGCANGPPDTGSPSARTRRRTAGARSAA